MDGGDPSARPPKMYRRAAPQPALAGRSAVARSQTQTSERVHKRLVCLNLYAVTR
jgi:hypothetical protein